MKDDEGYIYRTKLDLEEEFYIGMKNGKRVLFDIMIDLRWYDLLFIERKKEFYERKRNVKIDRIAMITMFIEDANPEKVIERAKEMGIEILTDNVEIEKI